MTEPLTDLVEELKPCRECGAPCSVQVIDGEAIKATLWVCSKGPFLGGNCPDTLGYLSAEAWNDRGQDGGLLEELARVIDACDPDRVDHALCMRQAQAILPILARRDAETWNRAVEVAAKVAKTAWVSADYNIVGIADADVAMRLCEYSETAIASLKDQNNA